MKKTKIMKESLREWQRQWREILGASVENVKDEVFCDSEIIMRVWESDESKQKQCFSLLPAGEKILARTRCAVASLSKKAPAEDDELLTRLEKMIADISCFLAKVDEEISEEWEARLRACTSRSVYRGNNEMRRKILGNASPVTEDLDDIFSMLIGRYKGERHRSAYFFLKEPVYQSVYDTAVRNWALWPIFEDEFGLEPYTVALDFYKFGAQAGQSDKEIFVFVESA